MTLKDKIEEAIRMNVMSPEGFIGEDEAADAILALVRDALTSDGVVNDAYRLATPYGTTYAATYKAITAALDAVTGDKT